MERDNKTKLHDETALEVLFRGNGVTDFRGIFPKPICEKCKKTECDRTESCAALVVIGAMAATAANRGRGIIFADDLRKIFASVG